MRIRPLLIASAVLTMLAGLYVALPVSTAWAIREAVTSGDRAYIERKVQWATVRETMRRSMLTVALDLPDPELQGDEAAAAAAAPQPGLWTRMKARLKSMAGRRVVDKMVASYVTAEGLPRLYRQRRFANAALGTDVSEPESWFGRVAAVWSRVRTAEFTELTAFEVEIADEFDAERCYLVRLELRGVEWILTELHVRAAKDAQTVADAR